MNTKQTKYVVSVLHIGVHYIDVPASASVETSKQRYSRVSLWIKMCGVSKKNFRSKVMA